MGAGQTRCSVCSDQQLMLYSALCLTARFAAVVVQGAARWATLCSQL